MGPVFALGAIWQLVAIPGVVGAGIGIAYGAMPALVMGAVQASETASANSLNTLMRSIGTSVSSAVAGVVLARLATSNGGHSVPSQAAFQVIMGIGAAAAFTALVVAAFLPRYRQTGSSRARTRTEKPPAAGAGIRGRRIATLV